MTVTCWVLKLARHPYYYWLAAPVTMRELEPAWATRCSTRIVMIQSSGTGIGATTPVRPACSV